MTTRIAVIGATGYTALELLKLLARHPDAEVVIATSRQEDKSYLQDVHPSLKNSFDLALTQLDVETIGSEVDFAFSCLPHAASASTVRGLMDQGVKVVDFSADYRLNDVAVYEKWYGVEHPDSERLGSVPYGLPELYRDEIREAKLVANPGCYPSSAILALTPLLQRNLISASDLIVNSMSGVSGAGRNTNPAFQYCESNESVKAYGVGTHRHAPEISQYCTAAAGENCEVLFTPHLVPMDRGIFTTCYALPNDGVSANDAMSVLRETYRDERFVRVVNHLVETKHVVNTNYCDIAVFESGQRLVVVSAIDNLIKGAAGAAVQNFNLMCGYDEATALL
ncbi:MAG: N-acetyl-gamma-glutamyl-phosphate reductase [Pirellulales bacterium]|jgi:N-acetyl-gamma-glutamyl-phosphate reductase